MGFELLCNNFATIHICVYNICRGEYHLNSAENVIFCRGDFWLILL